MCAAILITKVWTDWRVVVYWCDWHNYRKSTWLQEGVLSK